VGVAARAVLVTPLSGPLARFGNAGASALALWAEYCGVSLEVIDAYPSASSAMRAAEARRPDVVFGPYGSGPALAAAGASNGVVWNHGGATARLARPKYPRVVNLESPAYRYLAAVLETLAAIDLGEGSQVVIVRGVVVSREVVEPGRSPTRVRDEGRRVLFALRWLTFSGPPSKIPRTRWRVDFAPAAGTRRSRCWLRVLGRPPRRASS